MVDWVLADSVGGNCRFDLFARPCLFRIPVWARISILFRFSILCRSSIFFRFSSVGDRLEPYHTVITFIITDSECRFLPRTVRNEGRKLTIEIRDENLINIRRLKKFEIQWLPRMVKYPNNIRHVFQVAATGGEGSIPLPFCAFLRKHLAQTKEGVLSC